MSGEGYGHFQNVETAGLGILFGLQCKLYVSLITNKGK